MNGEHVIVHLLPCRIDTNHCDLKHSLSVFLKCSLLEPQKLRSGTTHSASIGKSFLGNNTENRRTMTMLTVSGF